MVTLMGVILYWKRKPICEDVFTESLCSLERERELCVRYSFIQFQPWTHEDLSWEKLFKDSEEKLGRIFIFDTVPLCTNFPAACQMT